MGKEIGEGESIPGVQSGGGGLEASMGLIAGTELATSKDRKLRREGGREGRCL